jgi:preprotein translocase subunit SecG
MANETKVSSFGFCHSLFFRHSCFVLRHSEGGLPRSGPPSYNVGFAEPSARVWVQRKPSEETAMPLFAEAPWWSWLWNLAILLLGTFLILLVLIQRGKGGGLAGAFGGAGGSSAFGSRAGDTFTRITIGVAAAWILMLMIQVKIVQGTAHAGGDAAPQGTIGGEQAK